MWRELWFNAPKMKLRRQKLRREATESEKIIWEELKQSQLGVKFIRQYSIKNWVVDFYCPEQKLVIEVDGDVHESTQIADKHRDRFLMSMGMRVIRVKNEEIVDNIGEVVEKIKGYITSGLPATPS